MNFICHDAIFRGGKGRILPFMILRLQEGTRQDDVRAVISREYRNDSHDLATREKILGDGTKERENLTELSCQRYVYPRSLITPGMSLPSAVPPERGCLSPGQTVAASPGPGLTIA
jgi:hypothetical protein